MGGHLWEWAPAMGPVEFATKLPTKPLRCLVIPQPPTKGQWRVYRAARITSCAPRSPAPMRAAPPMRGRPTR